MNAIFLPGDGVFHAVRWAVWRLYEDIEQDVLSTEPSGLDPISALLRSWRPSDSVKNPSLFSGRRKDPSRSFGLYVGIPCLPGQAKYCPAIKNSPVDCFRQKKDPSRSFGLCVGLSCLPGQAKYCPAVKNSPVDCFRQKKRLKRSLEPCVGITYLPGQSPAKYCRRR